MNEIDGVVTFAPVGQYQDTSQRMIKENDLEALEEQAQHDDQIDDENSKRDVETGALHNESNDVKDDEMSNQEWDDDICIVCFERFGKDVVASLFYQSEDSSLILIRTHHNSTLPLAENDRVIVGDTCKHIFHKVCIIPWMEKHMKCPTCRDDMLNDAEFRLIANNMFNSRT